VSGKANRHRAGPRGAETVNRKVNQVGEKRHHDGEQICLHAKAHPVVLVGVQLAETGASGPRLGLP